MTVQVKKLSLDDITKLSEKHGFYIRYVGKDKLHDYAGMNPVAANDMGFKMPDNEIWIDKDLSNDIKCDTISHELNEIALMQQGKQYWPAHVDSLKREVEGDIHLPEKPESIREAFAEEPQGLEPSYKSRYRKSNLKPAFSIPENNSRFGIGPIRRVGGGLTRRTRTGRVL